MWDVLTGLAILALALLIVAKLQNEQALRFEGPFSVIDGDTLAVPGERLRLDGIDAPERAQTCMRPDGASYACGEVAQRGLGTLVSQGRWFCSGTSRDRYDRLLVICRRGSVDLAEQLVSSGWAVADGRYLTVEAKARLDGKGIWAGAFERPAEWRRLRKIEEAELTHRFSTYMPRWLLQWFED
jgi:endonuclease YncB( thermonuclease family)